MTTTLTVRHAETDTEIASCFGVMKQLRHHLETADSLVAQVSLQRAQAYRLLAVWDQARPLALAGYRQLDNMIHGRFIYIDDLVTASDQRGQGHGERLIRAVGDIGRSERCARIVLDTALSNALAQRFYFRAGLLAQGLHFSMDLQ